MEKILPSPISAFLEQEIAGNSVEKICISVLIFFGILLMVKIFRSIILRKFKKLSTKTKTQIDDKIFEKVSEVSLLFYLLLALFLTTKLFLTVPPATQKIVDGLFSVVLAYEILKITQVIIFFWLKRSSLGKNTTSLQGIKMVVSIFLWAIGALLVFSNLGFDVSTLVASLGIGGIAVALAAQNILGDLFASFTIYFDKPFEVGDYIVIGEHSGTVKRIGLKTTRLQTLQGEELIVSNTELTSTRVQNFKKLKKRRIPFSIGVTYDTPQKKLEKIPEIIKKIIKNIDNTEFERAHFHTFGDFSLEFETVYYVLDGDYEKFMDTQQKINFAILSAFEKEEIEMAFPTQTLYLKK